MVTTALWDVTEFTAVASLQDHIGDHTGHTKRETQTMNAKNLIRAAAIVAFTAASAVASASPEAWDLADQDYQAQRFANALKKYESLALAGDARAAEIAGHMLALGESLYGDAVRRDPVRAVELLRQASRAGRPVASHLIRHVEADAAPTVAVR
jgi:TPR repeat protein